MVIHSFAREQIQNENAEGEGYSKKAIKSACSGEAQQRQGSHLLVAATILATFGEIARTHAAARIEHGLVTNAFRLLLRAQSSSLQLVWDDALSFLPVSESVLHEPSQLWELLAVRAWGPFLDSAASEQLPPSTAPPTESIYGSQ